MVSFGATVNVAWAMVPELLPLTVMVCWPAMPGGMVILVGPNAPLLLVRPLPEKFASRLSYLTVIPSVTPK